MFHFPRGVLYIIFIRKTSRRTFTLKALQLNKIMIDIYGVWTENFIHSFFWAVLVLFLRISDPRSNQRRGCLCFISCQCPWERDNPCFLLQSWVNSIADWVLQPWLSHLSKRGKTQNLYQIYSAPTVRSPTSHHENSTCRTLLEKQGRAHKWCTPMDPLIWLSKSRTTSSNLHTAALGRYGM